MSVDHFGLTESEWDVLKEGPAHMLRLIAGADSHIDRAEWTALVDAVLASVNHQDALVQALMEDLSDELHHGAIVGDRDGSDALHGLQALGGVLDLLPDRGAQLRETLLQLGATIAESSGAQLTMTFAAHHNSPGWARAAGTSATEREALRAAAAALGIT